MTANVTDNLKNSLGNLLQPQIRYYCLENTCILGYSPSPHSALRLPRPVTLFGSRDLHHHNSREIIFTIRVRILTVWYLFKKMKKSGTPQVADKKLSNLIVQTI